jgi:deoxyadenosine/deoxycytidine kinase
MSDASICIAISGGIAVGKTTLAQMLHEKLPNNYTFFEEPGENPFLADFYSDMKRWAFHSRIAMLALFSERFLHIQDVFRNHRVIVMDRSIHELITFANLQFAKGNLSQREFKTYSQILNSFIALSPRVDCMIYLHCSPSTALTRISQRGRDYERTVSEQYINEVTDQYQRWIPSLSSEACVLDYNTDSGVPVRQVMADLSSKLNI